MRDRGSVVLVENNKVGLIKRIKKGSVYYVFPGGGIEEGESPETGAKREAFEELGVKVNVIECFAKVEFNGTQYFFLAEIIEGTFGTGQGEEYTNESRDRGTYLPIWVEIEKLPLLYVKPEAVALKIQSIFN
ncbi:NUDIX hydrolase [Peribacillus frigoritolerans]|uniref:NUDIX hydrolase n=1 Tax=Peribacillus castrilensis TaxID=2897690 RepID=UPI002DCFF3D3|nr:NUDIX domain-containing protein [Peribacillus castrilensis]